MQRFPGEPSRSYTFQKWKFSSVFVIIKTHKSMYPPRNQILTREFRRVK